MQWVAVAGTAITFAISVSLIVLHLRRYRCPKEQRQIIRLIFAPFVFALVALFEVLSYEAAPYIDPIGDYYEAFALCGLFLLYLQYAVPGGTFDQETFDAVKAAEEGDAAGFDWPRITWIFVFQYPVLETVAIIIQEATQATGNLCVQSLEPKFGHLWVEIISSIGVGAAVMSILRFYGRMKNRIKIRRGLAKLVCFKLIVFLRFVQQVSWIFACTRRAELMSMRQTIFSILLGHDVIKPSKTTTYNDLFYGLPSVLTCVEMAILSLGFWYAFSSTEYGSNAKPRDRPLPIHKAILDAINPWDLIVGVGRMFSIIIHLKRSGGFEEWQAAKQNAKAAKRANNPRGRRNQGRYRTVDGMESLPRPNAAYDVAAPPMGDTAYYPGHQPLYQPPTGSPPSYGDQLHGHLTANQRYERSVSPSGRAWDRYDHSRSPAGKSTRGQEIV